MFHRQHILLAIPSDFLHAVYRLIDKVLSDTEESIWHLQNEETSFNNHELSLHPCRPCIGPNPLF